MTIKDRNKIISKNQILNYISYDNSKCLNFKQKNFLILIQLVNKIRSYNQKGDKISISIDYDINPT